MTVKGERMDYERKIMALEGRAEAAERERDDYLERLGVATVKLGEMADKLARVREWINANSPSDAADELLAILDGEDE